MMKLRFRWASDIEIEGNSISEIKNKWENLTLEPSGCFLELEEVERVDDKSYKDYSKYF